MHDEMNPGVDTARDEGDVLMASPALSRRIIHRLQRGEHIDPFLAAEFRFLERHRSAWEGFFRFLGYFLCRGDMGGESFFYLKPDSGMVRSERLSRGATFMGIYLSWHFLTQGVDGLDSVPAAELAGLMLGQFDFNMLAPVFVPRTGRGRQRAETEQNRDKVLAAMKTALNELVRYRFVELRPSVRADWSELRIWRLPALQRFLEISRAVLVQQGASGGNPETVLRSLWAGFEADSEPDEDTDEAMEDDA
ncbi:MAG: hypothetical protein EOL86_10140 [Deltaproteobacteria bacterium]|nr:hypothetical protein [Deltaproteobacteria bacterium]